MRELNKWQNVGVIARGNAETLPGESRVANVTNDVQMVSRGCILTSDNNRLAITKLAAARWLSAEQQVRGRCHSRHDRTKSHIRRH